MTRHISILLLTLCSACAGVLGAPGGSSNHAIELRYVCDNEYIVLNRTHSRVMLRWNAVSGAETGEIAVDAAAASSFFRWTAFHTAANSSVQLFHNRSLVQTTQNERIPCPTSRPPVGHTSGVPAGVLATEDGNTARQYLVVGFRKEATGIDIQRVLSAYGATVSGGLDMAGDYVIKFPDPGPRLRDLLRLAESLRGETVVQDVTIFPLR